VVAVPIAPTSPPTGLPGLRADVERTDRAVIFHLTGRLDIPGTMTLWSELRRTRIDRPVVLLDLAGVPEIEPCALAVFATTQRLMRLKRHRFGLVHVRAQPLGMVRQRHLHRVVEIISGPLEEWLDGPPATSAAS